MRQGEWPQTLREARLVATPEAIRLYAEITNDFNPVHLDAEFAARTPFGRPIAHGTMSLALVWQALAATFGGRARPEEAEIRFSAPVRQGDALTAGGALVDAASGRYEIAVRTADGAALAGWVRIAAA
ncbi:MaoC family dehydratase [soil metagenome]